MVNSYKVRRQIMRMPGFKSCLLVGLYRLRFYIPVDRANEQLYVLMTHNIKEPAYASTFH